MEIPEFDDWLKLYQEDPEAFDRKRQEFLEEYIQTEWADDPNRQQRARAILWRMEQNFRHVQNPTERFNMVVAEFYSQVMKFNDALHYLQDES